MRLFICLLLQFFVFLPLGTLAADVGKMPIIPNHKKTEVTATQKAAIIKTYGKLPLYFIENKGQVDEKVSFYEREAGHATFFTSKGVVLGLTKRYVKADKTVCLGKIKTLEANKNKDRKVTTEAVSLSFVGANKEAKITAGDKKTGHVNYFVGNDKSKWRTNIPTYGVVTYKEVYKDIDIKFYGNNSRLEHDVIVRPGGDISKVKFTYKGVRDLKVNNDGDLEVSLNSGKLIEQKPVIYQEIDGRRVAVDGNYKIFENKVGVGAFTYGFTVASYDHTEQIVIDPVLVYSTYLGGSALDEGRGIAVDASDNTYVTGNSESLDFPLMNPIQASNTGGFFITKINPAGSALVYSTYISGSGGDNAYSMALDSSGSAYVTGLTYSTDFPVVNPIQVSNAGGQDAFVTKVNPAGSALVWSTYLGGGSSDFGFGIAIDATGSAYITGGTASTDFPMINPIQGAFGGGFDDAFITKINPAGSAFAYSTYIGGTADDEGHDIAVDGVDNAYVTGITASADFPTASPLQGAYGGGLNDAFVTKVNAGGTALVYSTYLGGISYEGGEGITVDNGGFAHVTGWTQSTDFPLMNPIQATVAGLTDAFITKLNPGGTALVYSTYLGGALDDQANAIVVDNVGNAYVTGVTYSTDFPVVNPIQGSNAGVQDAFITKINPAGSALAWSTYLGGTNTDYGGGIAVDGAGTAYVTGGTLSTNFPTASPFQGVYAGLRDAFIAKIGTPPPPTPVVTLAITPDAVSIPQGAVLGYTVTATNTTAVQQCFNYWENVTLPGGGLYPSTGSLMPHTPRLCLNGGTSQTVHLTHGVPLTAPIGAYAFNTYLGIYPVPYRIVVDSTSFNFNIVTGAPAPIQGRHTSWRLIENGFRR